jgi:hypothetical protein
MAIEDEFRDMLNTYPVGEYMIETIEVSHSLFSQTYYLTREPEGISANIEGGALIAFAGTNIEIELNAIKSDLDQDYSFTLPDLSNQLDDELDNIPLDDTESIIIKYRLFMSSDLTEPAQGVITLSVFDISQEKGIFTAVAGIKQMNWNKTGEIYDYDTVPMLRAF